MSRTMTETTYKRGLEGGGGGGGGGGGQHEAYSLSLAESQLCFAVPSIAGVFQQIRRQFPIWFLFFWFRKTKTASPTVGPVPTTAGCPTHTFTEESN